MKSLKSLTEDLLREEEEIKLGGGAQGKERQRALGRLTARERIKELIDPHTPFFELGLWAGWKMYQEWGRVPAGGVITGVAQVSNRQVMIIANDATVKAGAMFPQSVKKVLRAQRIAYESLLPVIYLVDSSGVFLPLQDEIFPDEDDFGRIFRNNAIFSQAGIPQIAAIMGNCIAGGAYLPVLCDHLVMTKGSGLYLAGPALVKAAIHQEVSSEELGGAKMHMEVSGTVDFLEEDDRSCLKRIRSLMSRLKEDPLRKEAVKAKRRAEDIYDIYTQEWGKTYEMRDLIDCLIDQGGQDEYKKEFGKSLVCTFATISGIQVGIVANQRKSSETSRGEIEIGGVIYKDSADKAARFIMNCNQMKIPLLFIQDVVGFMVGKAAEESGIIRSGAKMVSALSCSVVPKITLIVGNSFGAGHYALCGKAYDPNFIFAWPSARYAVMGGEQAASTLFEIQKRSHKKKEEWDEGKAKEEMATHQAKYEEEMDIRYGAARGWVDAIIPPLKTREILSEALFLSLRRPSKELLFHTGVFQV